MPEKAIEINESNWRAEVLDSKIPVLVDFFAPWCGPCKMLSPVIDKLAEEFKDKAKILKMNTDLCPVAASANSISAMPSVVIFNNGKHVVKIVGVNPEKKYREELNKIVEIGDK